MKRLFLPFFLAWLLAGCTAYDIQVARGRKPEGVQRFFVVGNANDSRGLDHRIVAALRARGCTVETGPRTMRPDDTQVVVTYHDRWAWDFGEHLVYLQITVGEPKETPPFATAVFSAKIPGRQSPAGIVNELVGRLLAGAER